MNSTKLCPNNSFVYNTILCSCNPGLMLNHTSNICEPLQIKGSEGDFLVGSGVDGEDPSLTFPATIFDFESVKKFTQSQAVFLEATIVVVLIWLLMCFFFRFRKLGDGRGIWFRIRWWISRLDTCFATRHWLADNHHVKKRKTELGGTFSIASWMLFGGLFAALLHQIIYKRTVEVHTVRATNAPDLTSFVNDMEINITTLSSMGCQNLRDPVPTVFTTMDFIERKVVPSSTFKTYSCYNTSMGPTLTLKCKRCPLFLDPIYISWQFVDLPNEPAAAVGFQFNLSSRNHVNPKHLSFVSGILKSRSSFDDVPVTFRGTDVNILRFNLFPRLYHNLHGLKLLQPVFHEFLPGSCFSEINMLKSSLERSTDGIINTTLYINPLSSYIVEIRNQNTLGLVSFLADVGGLYFFSICIFFILLVQCEYRFKTLREEDTILGRIRNRGKAQDHWDKVRKYVMYTWNVRASIKDDNKATRKHSCIPKLMEKKLLPKLHTHVPKQHQNELVQLNFNRNQDIVNDDPIEATIKIGPDLASSSLASNPMGQN